MAGADLVKEERCRSGSLRDTVWRFATARQLRLLSIRHGPGKRMTLFANLTDQYSTEGAPLPVPMGYWPGPWKSSKWGNYSQFRPISPMADLLNLCAVRPVTPHASQQLHRKGGKTTYVQIVY